MFRKPLSNSIQPCSFRTHSPRCGLACRQLACEVWSTQWSIPARRTNVQGQQATASSSTRHTPKQKSLRRTGHAENAETYSAVSAALELERHGEQTTVGRICRVGSRAHAPAIYIYIYGDETRSQRIGRGGRALLCSCAASNGSYASKQQGHHECIEYMDGGVPTSSNLAERTTIAPTARATMLLHACDRQSTR